MKLNLHLQLVPAGDETARVMTLEEIYRRYAPYVGRVALRLLGDRAEVDDLVQDVFVDAVRGLGTLRDPNAVRGWLAAVTTRAAARRLKRRRLRRLLRVDPPPDFSALEAPGATADQRALLACLYTVLEAQPVDARNAWILRHIEGESLGTVAVLCGCSLATAKRRIAAVHDAIAEALGNE